MHPHSLGAIFNQPRACIQQVAVLADLITSSFCILQICDSLVQENGLRHEIWRLFGLACRYAVLQEFGGFYIDLDIECLRPLDFLVKYPYVMPKTRPVGFSNDFMASEPGNNFVRGMVSSLPQWNMNLLLKYPTVMFSTGPMFVTLKVTPAFAIFPACLSVLKTLVHSFPDKLCGWHDCCWLLLMDFTAYGLLYRW